MYYFDGRIRFSEVDSEGRLTFASLLNYLQDCSTFQSEDLGLGVDYLKGQDLVWVLCSWQIVVERYPRLCDHVKVGTAPYEFKSFLGYRNFVMQTKEGEYYAKANSLWSLLNTKTGKPVMPTEEIKNGYTIEKKLDMEYASRKILVPEGGSPMESITVKPHHLDTNHHVNNGQYVDIAMDYLPEDFTVGQMRAEYKKQALLGDIFYPYVVQETDKVIVSLQDGEKKAYAVVEFTRK